MMLKEVLCWWEDCGSDSITFSSSNTGWPSESLCLTVFMVVLLLIYIAHRVTSNIIDVICNMTYIYNICWEDPAVDHQILKINKEDVIFRICSAGDVVLDYAIEGPSKIVVCDTNQHQLWLFELKICMLRDPKLTYEEWWSIWGKSNVQVALRVWKRMRHTMSARGRKWWDNRITSVFGNGFATSGSCGMIAKYFIPFIMKFLGLDTKVWANTGFSHEYIANNYHVIERATWLFRVTFPYLLAPFVGVPVNQLGPNFYSSEWYESTIRGIFLDPGFGSNNYFYRFYYEKGYKDQTCCPRTLQQKYFEALKANVNCFEWHHATVQETMERVKPNTFTKLVLLDHLDWMPNNIVHEEWIAIQRASVPGAQILWRSAFPKMDHQSFLSSINTIDLTAKWWPIDRVKTYPGTFMTYMPKEPLPFVDPEPSPCQRTSLALKVKTSANMILHPIISGTVSSEHCDKMSKFYASQAKGYDAVREHMLVARPQMMSAFGPIQTGHTWLDIGGGTGRNIHYLRAQLDLFERIVVLDICPELLEVGKDHARRSFTPGQCEKIEWVCMDINSKDIRTELAKYLRNDLKRGFDTISFSYSLSMIPDWENALETTKSLMSKNGRVIISDFDTYSENGTGVKDFFLRTWYAQDGVRIEAKTRQIISQKVFPSDKFHVTFARFRRTLAGVSIPHFVACCKMGVAINLPAYVTKPRLKRCLPDEEKKEE